MLEEALAKIKNKANLSEKETEAVFDSIMTGAVETGEIASFLVALKEKKETVEEITGAARSMRRFAVKINAKDPRLLDTCGTGGDESGTFNISTISA
ncbi:MAG: anthranilate phosphoribosyltransferase, partial [Candidatus Omnitrophica bacterium]|nr:anthranilate phosphoribosyltransferase [Candidatus Omnitrophota bacterium]